MYPLDVEVGGRKLLLAYNYQGGQLDSFAFLAIPSSWVAYQKVDSKTVRLRARRVEVRLLALHVGPHLGRGLRREGQAVAAHSASSTTVAAATPASWVRASSTRAPRSSTARAAMPVSTKWGVPWAAFTTSMSRQRRPGGAPRRLH